MTYLAMPNYLYAKTHQYHCQLLNMVRPVCISESADLRCDGYYHIQVDVAVCPATSYIRLVPATSAQVRIAG